jgi:hypothetical protein
MSMFENNQYRWRETYFVQFPSKNRPTLKKVQQTLLRLNDRFVLTSLAADEQGRFESLTIRSPDDFAAMDVCYLGGEEVLEQGVEFSDDMTAAGCREEDKTRLRRIRAYDGRFDVLHFEQITDPDNTDEPEEMLDPSALLVVLEALAKLTDGIAVDPQTGTMF